MIRDWGIWTNSVYKTANVELEEWPVWLFCLSWLAGHLDRKWMFKIGLPNWPKIRWFKDEDQKYTPKEWLGTFGDLVFYYISNPLETWCYEHPKRVSRMVAITYDQALEIDPSIKEWNDRLDRSE